MTKVYRIWFADSKGAMTASTVSVPESKSLNDAIAAVQKAKGVTGDPARTELITTVEIEAE
jgi:hypothetical protein